MAYNARDSISVLLALWIAYLATSDSNTNKNYIRNQKITGGGRAIVDQVLPEYTGELFYICMSLLSLLWLK